MASEDKAETQSSAAKRAASLKKLSTMQIQQSTMLEDREDPEKYQTSGLFSCVLRRARTTLELTVWYIVAALACVEGGIYCFIKSIASDLLTNWAPSQVPFILSKLCSSERSWTLLTLTTPGPKLTFFLWCFLSYPRMPGVLLHPWLGNERHCQRESLLLQCHSEERQLIACSDIEH